jgi:alpha-1,2-glucosyltransferase
LKPRKVSNISFPSSQDEVFHIRQAQHYCARRWDIWDPKITTPPGVYLLSYVARPVLGCSITALRALNVVCLVALMVVVKACYDVRRRADGVSSCNRLATWHASLNVVLFPPLFFFSALYYTDIASTLSCMVSYWYFLRALPSETFSIRRAGIQVLLGTASLFFRQTNIFWVAVFPAALTLVARLDQGHEVVKKSMYRRAEGFGDSIGSIAKTSYKMSVVYDPLVRDAFIEGKSAGPVILA